MNIKKSGLLWTIGTILIVGGAVFAFLRFWTPWQPARAPVPIIIATLKTPHSGLVQIAEAKGFFDEEGLSATVRTTLTGHEGIDQVLRGKADFGGTAETPIAKNLAEGKQLKVISTIFYSSQNVGVIGRRDRGIVRPEDLKGKRIGFIFGTASHYMLETFLAFHGIPADSVTLVSESPEEIVSALVSGALDAAATWNPSLTIMQQELGENAVVFFPEEFYAETCNLVIRPDYLIKNRETAERLIRALLKAEAFVDDHPEEAIGIIADASELDPGFLKGSTDLKTFQTTLKHSLLLATENEVRWYFRRGLVPEAPFPDVLNAFEPGPLKAIKPSAVSIAKGN